MSGDQYKQIFIAFDVDQSGSLDRQECSAAFRTLLHEASSKEEDVEKLVDAADENKDGTISLEEFCKVLSDHLPTDQLPDLAHLKDFVSLDSDKSGYLSGSEVEALFKKIFPDCSPEEMQSKVAACSSTEISYRAFADLIHQL